MLLDRDALLMDRLTILLASITIVFAGDAEALDWYKLL